MQPVLVCTTPEETCHLSTSRFCGVLNRHGKPPCSAWIWLLLLCLALPREMLGGAFPPSGIDAFPTASPFSVTINGVTYTAITTDPATTVGRSAATTEGTE